MEIITKPKANPNNSKFKANGTRYIPKENTLKEYAKNEITVITTPTKKILTNPNRVVETINSLNFNGVTNIFKKFFSHTSSKKAIEIACSLSFKSCQNKVAPKRIVIIFNPPPKLD